MVTRRRYRRVKDREARKKEYVAEVIDERTHEGRCFDYRLTKKGRKRWNTARQRGRALLDAPDGSTKLHHHSKIEGKPTLDR